MIVCRSQAELDLMHAANQVVATVRDEVVARVAPGVTTGELDSYAEARVRELGGVPAFKGYRGFPCTLCVSVNHQIVHGIPGDLVVNQGDIVSLDLGAIVDGVPTESRDRE